MDFSQQFNELNNFEFKTRNNLQIRIEKVLIDDIQIFKLININLNSKKFMVYIHGGPNLSCIDYLNDTRCGFFRSVELLMQETNIIFVEQKVEIDNSVLEKFNELNLFTYIIESFGSEAQARRYAKVIVNFLKNENHIGIFAQSYGAQILFDLVGLNIIPWENISYITLSSPFVRNDNCDDFLLQRREKVQKLISEMAVIFQEDLKIIKSNLSQIGMEDYWNKLSVYMTHPAYPVGIIENNLRNLFKKVHHLNQEELKNFFKVEETDLVNYIIGSFYFTPLSNYYESSKSVLKQLIPNSSIPDEMQWFLKSWEKNLNSKLIHVKSKKLNDNLQHFIYLAEIAKFPIFIYFDPKDISIPVDRISEALIPQLEKYAYFECRENYGHWIGNYIFHRQLRKIV